MLDARTYHHLHKNTSSTNRVNNDYLSKEKHAADSPPDPVFQHLLPPTIPGFGFHDKKWNFIPVDDIDEELHWNVEAFDHLVLKSPKKDLIRALVTKHIASSNGNVNGSGNDVIANKGSGLILLLHGSPGTGKTLTAESVSELIQRPLYRITSGDMGTNAKEAEQYLESVLYLASVWRCVVLLDEADVFLEQRSQQDLEHNALVSVFLRMIEYYFSGILFLTTTRIGTLDGAFKSRVQLAVHYPPLDESSR
ncbi:P-loop containing nucleoside triphosphate hydrolase protein, partial [Aspergillus oleicola]